MDEPGEQLLQLAPRHATRLLMPRLGEPVEPARAERVEPWWRAVAALERRLAKDALPVRETQHTVDGALAAPGLPLD